jgi:hypothetical protein
MRGALFSYVDLEVRVPHGHPLRTIRLIVNEALAGFSPGFHDLYARIGRPSITPEQLLRALLLQAFYSNRHGLVVDAELTRASGHAERLAALAMLDRLPTVGPHNDADPASGRGWATLGTAGCLVGHLFIHNSDDSPFVAERE